MKLESPAGARLQVVTVFLPVTVVTVFAASLAELAKKRPVNKDADSMERSAWFIDVT
jgi:hypothetical protein